MSLQIDEIHFIDQGMVGENVEQLGQIEINRKFKDFIQNWQVDNEFVYRNQLINNGELGNHFLKVQLRDLKAYDEKLLNDIRYKPLVHIDLLERAIKELYCKFKPGSMFGSIPDFQLQLVSSENPRFLRSLKSDNIGMIIHIEGIIISAGSIQIKAENVVMKCGSCKTEKNEKVEKGLNGFHLPTYCDSNKTSGDKCAQNPYVVLTDNSTYVDMQILKIQESPENLPTGEIPRTYKILCEKFLVDKMIPGNRVQITGIYTLIESKTLKSSTTTAAPPRTPSNALFFHLQYHPDDPSSTVVQTMWRYHFSECKYSLPLNLLTNSEGSKISVD